MICNLFSEPQFLVFSADAPVLLYYSHIPTAIAVLLIGVFVYTTAQKSLVSRLLFFISLCLSLWIASNLILWTNIHSDVMLFVWTLYQMLFGGIAILSVYFMYAYLQKRDIPRPYAWTFTALLAPLIIFVTTPLNLGGLNITDCDAIMYEGPLYKMYSIFLGVISFLWILTISIRSYLKAHSEDKKQILLMAGGIEFFLFSFFSLNFIASYLTDMGVLQDSSLEFYGLFGITFFVGILAYLIVRYHAFNIKLAGAQALMVTLMLLVGSQFFFVETMTALVLSAFTFALTLGFGYFLIRSVKKEIEQREEIAKLAVNLEKANDRLKVLDKMKSEFVSIASHQLRSPLTSIRGYASMLAEGSYGKLTAKAQDVAERISESAKYMALSVEDYLNVSRIEAGNMKYEMTDFNLRDVTEKITDELRTVALKKGLVMVFRSDIDGSGLIHADIGKTRQIIMNIIDNSMKYTPKGTITVVVHDDVKAMKIMVTVRDTGVGMSIETQGEVFEKFVRAKNANNVNVTGTGLGLYVAKKMVTDMGGRVWAESEGEGKGSQFHIEFPVLPGKPRQR